MYASHWECKPKGIMKVKNSIANLRRDHGWSWYPYLVTGFGVRISWTSNPSEGWAYQEHTRWDPKDGELCLVRTKSGETLMEVRSDSDVQIDRRNWV